MAKQLKNPIYKEYIDNIVEDIQKEFKIGSPYGVPEVKKVIVNVGVSKAKDDKALLEEAVENLKLITGQQPVVTRAKKAISNFTLKKGNPIGCKVTLRGERMYAFIHKLLTIAIPRIRDFGGLKRSIDRFGNLTIGINDESIFPEINQDKLKMAKGFSISIITNRQERKLSEKLFERMGFPFKD